MRQSGIAHDGIFGFGNEKQNILAEKEFEEGAAKGFRPCTSTNHQSPFPLPRIPSWPDDLLLIWETQSGPSCKKMNDISPNAIFLSSSFEPTPEELRAFVRSEKERSRSAKEKKPVLMVPSTSMAKVTHRPTPPPESVELSSDEDMPDFKQILARSKKIVSFFSVGSQ
jgi:hypothetical protein